MEGGQAFACRDIRRRRNDRGGISLVSAEHAKPEAVSQFRPRRGCSDQRRCGKTAGAWLPFGLPVLDRLSKNGVGRTGFEPVTSSVSSGNSRVSVTVGLSRTGSPRPCEMNLIGSRYVRGRRVVVSDVIVR